MTAANSRPVGGAARPYHFPATEQVVLANGLTVITAPLRRLPAATVLLVTPAGGEREGAGEAGLAAITALGVTEGTSTRDTSALAAAFERLGGEMFSEVEWTHAEYGTTVMSARFEPTLALMAETVRTPAFPEQGIARLRDERLAELLQLQREPRGLADDMFLASCFPEEHRLARPLAGSRSTVEGCSASQVRGFHASHAGPMGSVLIVAGDVDPGRVARDAERVLGAWQGGSGMPDAGTRPPLPGRRTRLVDRPDAPQSEIRIGHACVPRTHPDFHALAVMNAILGGLFNSRINLNLREEHAYTYGAFSALSWRRSAGVFEVSTAVQSDVTGAAVTEVLAEIDRMRTTRVTPDELALAIDYLTGVFPLRFETTAAIANALALRVGYGLGATYYDEYRERIRAVDAEAVRRVAEEHLQPGHLQVVVVGNAEAVRPALDGLSHGALDLPTLPA